MASRGQNSLFGIAALRGASLVVAAFACGACESDGVRPPLADREPDIEDRETDRDRPGRKDAAATDGGPMASERDATAVADASAAAADAGTGADAGQDSGPTVANCGAATCRGHGSCVDTQLGPTCRCDEGYLAEGEAGDIDCVVDQSCKRIRYLEDDSCRYLLNNIPAVAMFFAVDYCAGTAVLPEDLGDLSEAFDIFENGANILDNEESVATVIERGVESYVTIALDVSKSVTGVDDDESKREQLSQLVGNLREFVRRLGDSVPAGSPPVTVSVNVFGRFVAEYVDFTTDLDRVDAALSELEEDPLAVVQLVGGDGTALYQAVTDSIRDVERVRSLRSLVTDTGVLTSGTVVVVTDGRESTGAKLDTALIAATKVNVISIGISEDIRDEDLTSIGRDGSFLAPTPEDWEAAFDEIAVRVEQYPDRTYLLAYCSSATTGTPTVSVGLRGQPVAETAACTFDADLFSVNPDAVCDLAFFDNHCESENVECGSFLACGGCPSSQCCADNVCQAPSAVHSGRRGLVDCHDDPQLCEAEGQVCDKYKPEEGEEDPPSSTCEAPVAVGDECKSPETNGLCQPGVSRCEDAEDNTKACSSLTLSNGDVCGSPAEHPRDRCPELNCARSNPDSTVDPFVCQPGARIFDRCGGATADAECEPGSFCNGSICQARSLRGCNVNRDCLSGYCNADTRRCEGVGACYWNWDKVVTSP